MSDHGRSRDDGQRQADEDRARIALAQLRRDKWARAVRIGGTHGWVWDDRNVSDDQWRERHERRLQAAEPVEGTTASGSIGIIRLSAPEAHVAVIGPRSADKSKP